MSKPQENSPAAVLLKAYVDMEELLRLYSVALSIQYERPQKGGQHGGRQKGTHSDPTGSMGTEVSSGKGVRAAVKNVEAKSLHLHDTITALKRQLEGAIDRWDS